MYAVAPAKRQTFDFEVEGKEYHVPYMKHMPLLKKINKAKQNDAYIEFIASIFTEHASGSIEGLTVEQFTELMKAYIAEGNATAGE